MGGSNSKNAYFDNYPKNYKDVPSYDDCSHVSIENNWKIRVKRLRRFFSVEVYKVHQSYEFRNNYEFWYQLRVINKHHLKKERVRRGVAHLLFNHWELSTNYKKCHNAFCEPSYNQYNFQVIAYAIIEKNGLRKLNFEDKNVYGKSMTVLTTQRSLHVPMQFINIGAPLLAKYIDKKKPDPKLDNCLEEFFQVFHGVHVQLEEEEIKSLLKISAKFQVMNVKRYCEQQLIRREDFEFSEKRKFKMACKYNLNILMNQLLREVKTVEELAKLASIAIEMEPVNTNISKLLVAKMYQIS